MPRTEAQETTTRPSVTFVTMHEAKNLWPGCMFGKIFDYKGAQARRIVRFDGVPLQDYLIAVHTAPHPSSLGPVVVEPRPESPAMHRPEFICDIGQHDESSPAPAVFKRPQREGDTEDFTYACAACALKARWVETPPWQREIQTT